MRGARWGGKLKVMASLQGEEGPPSLEYIQAKDLFPPKELVKEEENLQVRRNRMLMVGGASCPVCVPDFQIFRGYTRARASSWASEGSGLLCLSVCALYAFGLREGERQFSWTADDQRPDLTFLHHLPFPQGLLKSRAAEKNKGETVLWAEGFSDLFQVPFTVLQGEGVEFLGRAADALIAISNYRLHIKFKDSVINVSSCLIFLTPKSRSSCTSKWYCSSA